MIKILYEDKHLAVAVKPRGVLSEGGTPGSMPALLREVCGTPFYSVHRLDRETAGIMVYAKSGRVAGLLSEALGGGGFLKEYQAVVHGVPSPPYGEYRDLLFRDAKKNKTYLVDRKRTGVREAFLSYETRQTVIKDGHPFSLVFVRLGTGRTHQIRAQFSGRGMPLYGDGRYGGRERAPLGLFAYHLSFAHPITKKPLDFYEEPPREEAFLLFGEQD